VTYVPIVPTVTPEAPSRQTRELADLLGRVIQEYEKAHPTVTGREVGQALQLAKRASSKAAGGEQAALVAALVGGLVLMLGLGMFLFTGGGDGFSIANAQVMVAVVALGLAGVFVAVLKRRE
jgi:predicted lipid-binding transport protein (Tim44 family)